MPPSSSFGRVEASVVDWVGGEVVPPEPFELPVLPSTESSLLVDLLGSLLEPWLSLPPWMPPPWLDWSDP